MSSARDNSLKQWVFDGVDGSARLLKFRSGHAAPPTVVRHYGAGKLLLSAGGCRHGSGPSTALLHVLASVRAAVRGGLPAPPGKMARLMVA